MSMNTPIYQKIEFVLLILLRFISYIILEHFIKLLLLLFNNFLILKEELILNQFSS